MSKGLQTTLWILSSLAVLWTVIALIGLFTMGSMMRGSMMSGGYMMGGMPAGAMMGGWMATMILHITLTWAVMLGLVGVFFYLLTAAKRAA
jgi:hypothetical protein